MLTTFIRKPYEGDFDSVAPGIFVRDLGLGTLTGGEMTAQIVRLTPEGAHVEELHRHDEGFSLAYVLKGWLDVEFEEIGVQHLGRGAVVPAFNGPVHRELTSSNEVELLLFVTRKPMGDYDTHRIFVQQERDTPYETGIRDGFLCRDFGLKGLTDGRMLAASLKPIPGLRSRGKSHTHGPYFQSFYVAEGSMELEYDDLGIVRLEQGAIAYQPPTVRHAAISCSDDLVIVEVNTPSVIGCKP